MSLPHDVAEQLRRAGVRFALIGAGAMAVHGVSRATRDLDLLVVDPVCLTEGVWAPLRSTGVSVEIRRGDADDPLAGVVRCRRGDEPPVDLVVGKDAWQADLLAAAADVRLDDLSLPVAPRWGLVLLKLFAGGPQDAWDVIQLLEGPERGPTVAAVEGRLPDLPPDCAALWARLRA